MDNEALSRAIDAAGGQTALARALGVKQANVWWWLNRSGRVPAEQVIPIEVATGVTRHELRPDLYPNDARAA
jgi:DNA-binding transcriptional regulator YdaS (Cro superfamily)